MMESDAAHGMFSVRSPLVASSEGGVVSYNPYANMHDPTEAKVEWLTENGYHVRGIVHIGANDGKEIAWYITKGYKPVIAFEPHPEAFKQLKEHYWNHAMLWPMALGADNGIITLNIPQDGDTEKSSKYKTIPTEGHDWTQIPAGNTIEVTQARFDLWAIRSGIDLAQINVVVIDVQGMELEVLRGFGHYLSQFEFYIVECSKVPVYDGEASAQQVIDWMEEKGFVPLTPIEEHDDIIFKRIQTQS